MPSPDAQPNIILFHCHDLGQHLGCYGQTTVHSPRIDAFAEEGILLERSYCTAPQCSPSRASMFTGRYPHSNGVMGLTHRHFGWDLHRDEVHLAKYLRDAGYTTAAVGVTHESCRPPEELGFDWFRPDAMAVDVVDLAIDRIASHRKLSAKPLYLQAGCIEPHRLPDDNDTYMGFLGGHLQPDAEYGVGVPAYLIDNAGSQAECAELQGAIRHCDDQFGRLLDAIDASGLAETSWVIFTTDHGIAMPRAKCSVYEPGLEVATILRPPRRESLPVGRRLRGLISNVDLTPTLLDLAGLSLPDKLQGVSYRSMLTGGTDSVRDAVFGEMTYHLYYDPVRSIRTDRWKLIVNFSVAPSFMDPSQSWHPRSTTRTPANPANASHERAVELYDLASDPFEQNDLATDDEYLEVRESLLAQLHRHLQETDDPLLAGPIPDPGHRRAIEAVTRPAD